MRRESRPSTKVTRNKHTEEGMGDPFVDREERREGRDTSRSPHRPKLGRFSGESGEQIESFLFQFDRIANRRHWSADHSACRLLDLLGGRALEFVKRLPETALHNYEPLAEHLRQQFSVKMNPRTARKELSAVRQTEGESVEEFSRKVGSLALDGVYHYGISNLSANCL